MEVHTAEWHIGVRTPCAPWSRARFTIHSSATGIRMMGLAPSEEMALQSCGLVGCIVSIFSSQAPLPAPDLSPGHMGGGPKASLTS